MPGDPTVARLTSGTTPVRKHTTGGFFFFSARFLPSTQPAAPDESTHAASCIAVECFSGLFRCKKSDHVRMGFGFRPRHPVVDSVGLAEGVVSERYHHPCHRHPTSRVSPDRLPTMRRRVFPDLRSR